MSWAFSFQRVLMNWFPVLESDWIRLNRIGYQWKIFRKWRKKNETKIVNEKKRCYWWRSRRRRRIRQKIEEERTDETNWRLSIVIRWSIISSRSRSSNSEKEIKDIFKRNIWIKRGKLREIETEREREKQRKGNLVVASSSSSIIDP